MLEEGLDLLIKERPNSEPARSDAAKDVRWHELLDVVLIDGTQKQKEWLTGNLQTFAELIRRIKAEASSLITRRVKAADGLSIWVLQPASANARRGRKESGSGAGSYAKF